MSRKYGIFSYMKLKDALNKIFKDAGLQMEVVQCVGEQCTIRSDETASPVKVDVRQLIELANKKFSGKFSSQPQGSLKLFSRRSNDQISIDLDPQHFGPEKILLRNANEWILMNLSNTVEITQEASSDCRRPMAVGYSTHNETFFTWSGPDMRPQVAQYNNKTSACIVKDLGPIQPNNGYYDFHDYTHLIRTSDDHLIIFYSNHSQKLWQLRSPMVNSIEGEWEKSEIRGITDKSIRATYPMPIVTNTGDILVFYRVTTNVSDYRPLAYIKSTDHGRTWSEPKPAIDFLNTRPDHLNEIYIGRMIYDAKSNRILMSWTLAGGGPHAHKHDIYHKDIFYAAFDPSTMRFYAADGTDLGPYIEDEEARKRCLVYDSGSLDQAEKQHVDYKPLVQLDPKTGFPIIIFYDEIKKQTILARWNGKLWETMRAPFRARDFTVTEDGNLRALVSQGTEVRVYDSSNSGAKWSNIKSVTTPYNMDRILAIDSGTFFVQHTTKFEYDTDATNGGSPVYFIIVPK